MKKYKHRIVLDESIFGHIFKYQITELILQNDDSNTNEQSLEEYTVNVYASILILFENLKHLSIIESSITDYPPLSICDLPSTTFCSSILTKLCIDVYDFDDCLCLLDGRLKQLRTFIVRICFIESNSSHVHYTVSSIALSSIFFHL